MLETLFKKHHYINKKIENIHYKRYLFDRVDFNERLIGIVGARGSDMTLFEIAETFSNKGGKILVIDEIHKYPDFEIQLKEIHDFLVKGKYLFEVGGKNKGFEQIRDIPDSYIAADDIEIGFGNKIPLWLFGFLY